MLPEFNFIGFDPSTTLRENANRVLERLLDFAPFGSVAVSLLEMSNGTYRCAIEIYSKHGPFTATASDDAAEFALEKVARALSAKLDHWRESRYQSSHERTSQHSPSVMGGKHL